MARISGPQVFMPTALESSPRFGSTLGLSLVIGLTLAGSLAGYLFDKTRGLLYAAPLGGLAASDAQIRKQIELEKVGARKSSALGCGIAGALLAAAAAATLACPMGTVRCIVIALLGAMLGGAAGAGGGYFTQEASEYAISYGLSSSYAWMAISAAFWIPVGAAAGIVVAVTRGASFGRMASLGVVLAGALVAAALTPILGAIVFPLDFKGRIPPRTLQECLFVGAVGGLLWGVSTGFLFRTHSPAVATAAE